MCAHTFSKGALLLCNDVVEGVAVMWPEVAPMTPPLRATYPLLSQLWNLIRQAEYTDG